MEAVAVKKTVKMEVEGMTCTNCALSISKYLEKQGLENVSVNFSTHEVRFDTDSVDSLPKIKKGIHSLGYEVVEEMEEGAKRPFKFTLMHKFIASAVLTTPLLLHMIIPAEFLANQYFQLSLCIPVYLIGLWHFGKSALGSIKAGAANMDVLIILGATAAFAYSLTGTIMGLGHNYLFYETAATIITLVLLGNVIEKRSVERTTTAIKELSELQVSKARMITLPGPNGTDQTMEMEVDKVKVGQTVLVNSGEKIPLDGKIMWGEGVINESMVTGESTPVDKEAGDNVIGGTLLEGGSLKIRVEATGEATYLANIIDLVKGAQQDKPNIQKLADKVSSIFVPVVLSISVITFCIAFFAVGIPLQKAMLNSVAVLAIACPCAMGLATPTAVMVGVGRVTKRGILIKGASTIEELSSIKQVVFDKTGTLTTGNFTIREIYCDDDQLEKVKTLLYSLEKHSSHPIASSMVKELEGTPEMYFKSIQEQKGLGLVAEDKEGNQYQLGSFKIARKTTLDNKHDVYLLKNDKLLAAVDLQDEIKPDAKEAIEYLKGKGIRTVLLSGDRFEKCSKVATELGIDQVHAEKLPEQKLEIIEKLNKEMPTAMVGDGINDAPALAKATMGISLSNASQVAIDSSKVILIDGKLGNLKDAFAISNHTLSIIKQNLFWAFSYNIVAIPIAALGFLNPMVAAFSMAFSDVVVIANSLRLKSKRIR